MGKVNKEGEEREKKGEWGIEREGRKKKTRKKKNQKKKPKKKKPDNLLRYLLTKRENNRRHNIKETAATTNICINHNKF